VRTKRSAGQYPQARKAAEISKSVAAPSRRVILVDLFTVTPRREVASYKTDAGDGGGT
jgi:hypothetical protein